MTGRAALGLDRPDLALANAMAVVTRDLVLQNVHVVTADLPDVTPDCRDVDALAGMRRMRAVAPRARDQQRQH